MLKYEIGDGMVAKADDEELNRWARRLLLGRDGHIYDHSPNHTQCYQGVSTRIPVHVIQAYMQDDRVPTADWEGNAPLLGPRWCTTMDFVSTMRAASASSNAAFWRPCQSIALQNGH